MRLRSLDVSHGQATKGQAGTTKDPRPDLWEGKRPVEGAMSLLKAWGAKERPSEVQEEQAGRPQVKTGKSDVR
ncbi:MAG: hypothetical protein GY721_09420 [Deltaproteobacteria bacterium]|nr:hypothetical protein [Deltaproteobacteria bacterium]